MKSSEISLEINNEIYDNVGDTWWEDNGDGNLVSLRFLSNPVKFNYINTVISNRLKKSPNNNSLLDVGCGGGYLSEELAKAGLEITGIDPSNNSIEAARSHAKKEGLAINYFVGYGEELPFESDTFDFVCCCDVLEHVKDFWRIIKEVSRTLKNDGIFFYDTINRTMISNLIMIKILQEWKGTSFLDSNVHIWNMFIKPKELLKVLNDYSLVNRETKGLSPGMNFIAHYLNLRRRAKGKISWQELGKRLNLKINSNLSCSYIGYAIKSNDFFS